MKRILSLILAVATVLASLTVLASCGTPKDLGAEIDIYLGEGVFDLDPTEYVTSDNANALMSLIFEPLFSLSAKGKLQKAAAKKYKVDKEKRTIEITLRETYWSDGRRVTASDFLYAWRNVLLEPNNANPAAALLYDIENAVEVKNGSADLYDLAVVAENDKLIITYREGADYKQLLKNLASVATSPLREDIYSQAKTYWSKKQNFLITNGQFNVDNCDYENGYFDLSRNEGYHQSLDTKNKTKIVNPHYLVTKFEVDGETKTLTYDDVVNKTVFFLGSAPVSDLSANKKKLTVADALSTYTYVFNTKNPLFANKTVREALSLAIDREAIASALVVGTAADGFLPKTVLNTANGKTFRKDALIATSANIAKAKELLATVDFTGIDKNIELTVEDNEKGNLVAEAVKAAWDECGMTVTVNKVSSNVDKDFVDAESASKITIYDSAIQATVKDAALGAPDFDVIALDWNMYSTDPFVALAAFATDFSGNGAAYAEGTHARTSRTSITGWNNAEYNELIKKAFETSDKKQRNSILADAEKMLVEEAVVMPIVYNQNYAFISKELKKVEPDGFGFFGFIDAKQKNYRKYLAE